MNDATRVRFSDLKREWAAPGATTPMRTAWTWRPLASLTPAMVGDVLRRASVGDVRDFLLYAADVEEKDLNYRAVLQTRRLAVAGLPLRVEPADDSEGAHASARLTEEALARLDVPELLAALLDALGKGVAVAEIAWDTAAGLWRPEAMLLREPHWFGFDRDDGRTLRLLDGSADGQALPAYKFVAHTPRVGAGLPIMGALARSALWAWVFKSHALRDWASFCELYGQPVRLGKYDSGAQPEDIAVLRRAAVELGTDLAAVIPHGMALELVESGAKSASADLYQRLIEYLDRQVTKCVLGQTGTTEQGGSFAQAKVHNEVRADLVAADARALAATLTRDLVRPLVRLNLGPGAPLPRLSLPQAEPEDLSQLATQLRELVQMNTPVPRRWVLGKWGIPEADGDEPLLGWTPSAAPEPEGPGLAQALRGAQSLRRAAPAVQAVQAQAARLAQEAAPGWAAVLAHVQRMAEEAASMEELREALLNALPALPLEALAEVMGTALTAAEAAGRWQLAADSDTLAAQPQTPDAA